MSRKAGLNGLDLNGQRLQNVGAPTAAGDAVPKSYLRYDISAFATGQPLASEVLMDFISPVAFTLPINFAGSVALVSTAPSSAATFTLTKNGVSVGTVNFAAGATTATFTASSAVNIAQSDRLQLIAPSTQDSALANFSLTFAGVR